MAQSPAVLLCANARPLTRPSGTLSPLGRGEFEAAARVFPRKTAVLTAIYAS